MKRYVNAGVISQEEIAQNIFSMWLDAGQIAAGAVPGQFISLYSADASRLLPRPISLCEIDREGGRLRIVYRIAGAGTREFSQLRAGDAVRILGPLGNGYPLEEKDSRHALLIAGGIGVPPMLALAKTLQCRKTIILGYRSERFLLQDFQGLGEIVTATEDGSAGMKGNVMDAIAAAHITGDVIYSCGPKPMLRAVKDLAMEQHITAWVSLEERMACGIGACLGCVCESTDVDAHSHVHNKRVCKDGPVFDAREVVL